MTDPIVSSGFLQELKKATARLHQELEELLISKTLISPEVSVQDYLTYLKRMNDVIVEVESEVFPLVQHEIPDVGGRRKSGLFQKDFQALGVIRETKPNLLGIWKPESSVGFAMGIMYVIEGSTLGGRMIYKHVQKFLDLDADSGAAYFAGYSENTGNFWKEFMATLARHEEKYGNSQEIINGANHAFGVIGNHLLR